MARRGVYLRIEEHNAMKAMDRISKLWRVDNIFYGSLVVLILVYYFEFNQAEMFINPDTPAYIEFNQSRTSGYPLFLWLTRAAFGVVEGAAQAQLALSAAAYAFLGWSIYKVFHAPVAALVLVYFLVSHPELAWHQPHIMTESLFITLLCVMMGTLMILLVKPRWWLAAVSALACGLAIMIRPVGVSLLPVWPILLWFIWRRCDGRHIRVIAAIVVPIALCLLVDHAVWRAYHGLKVRTDLVVTNLHLFSKALMIQSEPEPAGLDEELARYIAIGREVMAPVRELIDGAPDQRTRAYLLTRFESTAPYRIYERALRSYEQRPLRSAKWNHSYQIRGEAGWAALASAPVDWVKNAIVHYWGLWTAASGNFTPDSAMRYNAYIKDTYVEHIHGPLFRDAVYVPYAVVPGERLYRWGMMLGFCASVLSLALAVSRRMCRGMDATDNRLVAAGLAGLMVHGYFLVIGLFAFGLGRYAIPMFPLLAVCCLLSADWALEKSFGIFSRLRGPGSDHGRRGAGYSR